MISFDTQIFLLLRNVISDYVILFCLSFIFINNIGYWFFLIVANKFKIRNDSFFKMKNSKLCYNDKYPVISFIIPTYNEEKNIERKIRSLMDLNYQIDRIEIIIVDDGSKDKTIDIVKELQKNIRQIQLVQLQHTGPANALKIGSSSANGDIIIWTDADAFIQNKDAVCITIIRLSDISTGAIFGKALDSNIKSYGEHERHLFGNIQNLEGYLDSNIDTNGTFFAFRREFIGLIKIDCINYDANLAIEIRKKGFRVIVEPLIQMVHSFPKNMKSYLYRRMRMFVGCLEMLYLHYSVLFNRKYGYYGIIIAPRNLLFRSIEPIFFIMICAKIFIMIDNLFYLYIFLILSFIITSIMIIFREALIKDVTNQIFAYFARFVGYFVFVYYIYQKNIDDVWKDRGDVE